jgi:hypothetical protein
MDVAQGAELLEASDDLAEMSAIVAAMSTEDLERGMDLASLYGELTVAGDVMAELGLPVMAAFLADRGSWLREIAVDELKQYGASRALADAMGDTSLQVGDLGIGEVEEGIVRLAISDEMAEESEALAEAGIEMTVEGLADMAAAEAMRDAGATLAREGIATVADGAADIGASEALHATAERLESAADE